MIRLKTLGRLRTAIPWLINRRHLTNWCDSNRNEQRSVDGGAVYFFRTASASQSAKRSMAIRWKLALPLPKIDYASARCHVSARDEPRPIKRTADCSNWDAWIEIMETVSLSLTRCDNGPLLVLDTITMMTGDIYLCISLVLLPVFSKRDVV